MKSPGRLVDRRVLAIDWDRESIRIIHASTGRKGPRRTRGYLVPIPEGIDVDDPESLGQFIRRALRQRRIRTRHAIVAIPRDQAVLHMLSLPNVPLEEMPSVVHFQITKELPFALEEARIDFATFPAEAEAENVDVLVAAVRNDVLEHYQSVCQNAGLELERVGLRPFANTVAAMYGSEEDRSGCMLFVDVGPALTEIDLIPRKHLAFSRAASVNVPVMPTVRVQTTSEQEEAPVSIEPTEAEQQEAVDNLMVEVNRTIEAYRVNDPGAEIGQIIVAGSCGLEQRLCEVVGERFGAAARLYNPGERIDELAERGEEMTAFSAALGLTIGHGTAGALHFDFLHPKEPVDLTREKVRKVPVIAATVVLFIVAALVFRAKMASIKDENLKDIRQAITRLEKEVEVVEDFRDEVLAAEDWEKREVVWLDHLATVTELFPGTEQAYVTKFIASDKGSIRVHLKAKASDTPTKLGQAYDGLKQYNAITKTSRPGTDRLGFIQEGQIILEIESKTAPKNKAKTGRKSSRSKTSKKRSKR